MGHTRGNEKDTKSKATSRKEQSTATAPWPSRDCEEIREALLGRRREILERIDNMHASTNDAFTEPGDLGDWASASAETDLEIRIRESEVGELRSIDAALQRIEEGTYGICEDCGKPIPSARLIAIPNAAQCLECKMEDEVERFGRRQTPQRKRLSVLQTPAVDLGELSDGERTDDE